MPNGQGFEKLDLTSYTLPATVTYMGAGMLEGCGKLETLAIPFVGGCTYDYPLTEEEKDAIEGGDAVHPAESTGYLGYLFGATSHTFTAGYLPASLMTVTVLEGCESIPANAFFECASVREIHLPEGVVEIGEAALYDSFYRSITLPESLEEIGDSVKTNQIFLDGYICKEPVYRKTPLGREIADLLLAVNRPYGKSDYIPCICWGRNARFASGFDVGDHVQVCGRIQSREYIKKISESAALIETFAENLLQYVIDTKLDGIDMDWETPGSSHATYYTKLMKVIYEKGDFLC